MSGSITSLALPAGLTLQNLVFPGEGIGVLAGAFGTFGFETPDKLNFGGTQDTSVKRLLGGSIVIDLLGPKEEDITWSGYFFGPLASLRAQMVDQMRISGAAVPLVWPGGYRQVIVTKFACSYERDGNLLPYSITCLVIPNYAPGLLSSLTGSLNQGVSSAVSAVGSMP